MQRELKRQEGGLCHWFTLPGALVALALVLAACGTTPTLQEVGAAQVSPATRAMYAAVDDGAFVVPAIPDRYLTPENVRQEVDFWTDEPPGSIVVDPYSYHLYYVLGDNRAIRYRVGVGAMGRTFAGRATVGRKQEWPYWTPTANMIRIEPELYGPWAGGMAPGLENPLGSRAMYLYRNGRDTCTASTAPMRRPRSATRSRPAASGCISRTP